MVAHMFIIDEITSKKINKSKVPRMNLQLHRGKLFKIPVIGK
jgi:hypothetical protein